LSQYEGYGSIDLKINFAQQYCDDERSKVLGIPPRHLGQMEMHIAGADARKHTRSARTI